MDMNNRKIQGVSYLLCDKENGNEDGEFSFSILIIRSIYARVYSTVKITSSARNFNRRTHHIRSN